MISEELKAIVDKFKEQGKMNFFGETTEEKILAFEKEKEVTLPSKYKEWMLFSDGGELFLPVGVQLYGIEHKHGLKIIRKIKKNRKIPSRPSWSGGFRASMGLFFNLNFQSGLEFHCEVVIPDDDALKPALYQGFVEGFQVCGLLLDEVL